MSGRLGAADLAATTPTNLYQCPVSLVTTLTLSLCNRNSSSVTVRVSISSVSATMGNSEYIEYNTLIPANGVLERTGLVLDANKYLICYASTTGVSAVAWGFEDTA
jgi:hypothetical protein